MSLFMGEGTAKAVADVNNPDENEGGFASDDSDITGFSHMYVFCLISPSHFLKLPVTCGFQVKDKQTPAF